MQHIWNKTNQQPQQKKRKYNFDISIWNKIHYLEYECFVAAKMIMTRNGKSKEMCQGDFVVTAK